MRRSRFEPRSKLSACKLLVAMRRKFDNPTTKSCSPKVTDRLDALDLAWKRVFSEGVKRGQYLAPGGPERRFGHLADGKVERAAGGPICPLGRRLPAASSSTACF